MKTMKQLLYYTFFLLSILCISCDAEDGADGMDGMDGINGIDGQDGEQGPAGEDGNANVIASTIDPFPEWEMGTYLGAPSNLVQIEVLALDEATTADALVLVYFQLFGENTWYPMTLNFPLADGADQIITFTYAQNNITIYSLQSSGPLDAGITKARYFIIPTEDAGRSMNTQTFSEKLEKLGMDINNMQDLETYLNLR